MIIKRFLVSCIAIVSSLICSSLASESANPAQDEGLLLVAFGTSVPKAQKTYDEIHQVFVPQFGEKNITWTYTSDIIRKKLAKAGKPIPSIDEALAHLKSQGIKNIKVQSLHVAAGEEFSYMERAILRYALTNPKAFETIKIGRPLLESESDMTMVVKTLEKDLPKDRSKDEAVIYMAHGQSHGRADMVLYAMQQALQKNDPNTFFATVEGTNDFSNILKTLKEKQIKTAWLVPFMIVAGDHAMNDLAGDEEDSWASQLKEAGIEVKTHLQGMGNIPDIQKIFLKHAIETEDNLLKVK